MKCLFLILVLFPLMAWAQILPPVPDLNLPVPNRSGLLPVLHLGAGYNFMVPFASFLTPLTGGVGGGGQAVGFFLDFGRGSLGIYTRDEILTLCRPVFEKEYMVSRLRREGYRLAVCSNSIQASLCS